MARSSSASTTGQNSLLHTSGARLSRASRLSTIWCLDQTSMERPWSGAPQMETQRPLASWQSSMLIGCHQLPHSRQRSLHLACHGKGGSTCLTRSGNFVPTILRTLFVLTLLLQPRSCHHHLHHQPQSHHHHHQPCSHHQHLLHLHHHHQRESDVESSLFVNTLSSSCFPIACNKKKRLAVSRFHKVFLPHSNPPSTTRVTKTAQLTCFLLHPSGSTC